MKTWTWTSHLASCINNLSADLPTKGDPTSLLLHHKPCRRVPSIVIDLAGSTARSPQALTIITSKSSPWRQLSMSSMLDSSQTNQHFSNAAYWRRIDAEERFALPSLARVIRFKYTSEIDQQSIYRALRRLSDDQPLYYLSKKDRERSAEALHLFFLRELGSDDQDLEELVDLYDSQNSSHGSSVSSAQESMPNTSTALATFIPHVASTTSTPGCPILTPDSIQCTATSTSGSSGSSGNSQQKLTPISSAASTIPAGQQPCNMIHFTFAFCFQPISESTGETPRIDASICRTQ